MLISRVRARKSVKHDADFYSESEERNIVLILMMRARWDTYVFIYTAKTGQDNTMLISKVSI